MRHGVSLLVLAALAACGSQSISTTLSALPDVETHLRRLVTAKDPHAFLVITVAGTSHFLQFSADTNAIELDFPLVTADQKSREGSVRSFCQGAGFTLRESTGSDGTRFLDCDLPRDAKLAAPAVQRALRELFGVADSVQLLFEGDKLPPVAA